MMVGQNKMIKTITEFCCFLRSLSSVLYPELSHESNVLSYSECKIAKIFWGFALGPHWRWLTVPPRLPSCTTVFLLATLMEKLGPPKNWWIRHWSQCKINNQYIFSKDTDFKKFCEISGWEDRADQLLLQMSNSRQAFQIIHTLLLRILSFK